MKNHVYILQHGLNRVLAKIKLMKSKMPLAAKPGEVLFLHRAWIVWNERVDAGNFMPFTQKRFAQMRPNKTRRSGDEATHEGSLGSSWQGSSYLEHRVRRDSL